MRRALIPAAVLLTLAGGVLVALHFDTDEEWMFVGLTLLIFGAMFGNAAFNVMLRRSMDEEFEAGYRVGYRAGRRAPLVDTAVSDLDTFRIRRKDIDGRIPQAPIRAVAGDSAPPRRSKADQN